MRDLLFQTVGASSGWRVRARRVRRRVVEGWGAGPAGRVGGRQQREMLLAMKIYFFFVAYEFSRGGFFFEGDRSQRSSDYVQDVEPREAEGEGVGRILAGKEKGRWTVVAARRKQNRWWCWGGWLVLWSTGTDSLTLSDVVVDARATNARTNQAEGGNSSRKRRKREKTGRTERTARLRGGGGVILDRLKK